MRRLILTIAIALALFFSTITLVCRAARATDPDAAPAPVALGDERAYVVEMLTGYADAAACEARLLTKGADATYFRMKVVEIDQLEYRVLAGEPVKYREIDDAIAPLAERLSQY